MIRENLLNIRNRIEQASLKAGRDPSDITVVAVSKNFSADIIREGLKSGITDFW
jgi:PLP dependent protein